MNKPTNLTDPLGLSGKNDPCEKNPNKAICGHDTSNTVYNCMYLGSMCTYVNGVLVPPIVGYHIATSGDGPGTGILTYVVFNGWAIRFTGEYLVGDIKIYDIYPVFSAGTVDLSIFWQGGARSHLRPLPDWDARRPTPKQLQACHDDLVSRLGNPNNPKVQGASQFVSLFSIYDVKANWPVTAVTELVKYGLPALGLATKKPALMAAGETVALGSLMLTTLGTYMDAEARLKCGEPILP